MVHIVPKDQLKDSIGKEPRLSDWLLIDQDRINLFADATLDHQFIHVDAEKAKQTPFGSTIAHGYLTLSLLSHLTEKCAIMPEDLAMVINYGLNKVRFLQPVKVGSHVRAQVQTKDVTERSPGQFLVTSTITIEIKGEDKPALIAESLALFIVNE